MSRKGASLVGEKNFCVFGIFKIFSISWPSLILINYQNSTHETVKPRDPSYLIIQKFADSEHTFDFQYHHHHAGGNKKVEHHKNLHFL